MLLVPGYNYSINSFEALYKKSASALTDLGYSDPSLKNDLLTDNHILLSG
jgi:hypothetical protein